MKLPKSTNTKNLDILRLRKLDLYCLTKPQDRIIVLTAPTDCVTHMVLSHI